MQLMLVVQGGDVQEMRHWPTPGDESTRIARITYSSMAYALGAFLMFYHAVLLHKHPLLVDFWQLDGQSLADHWSAVEDHVGYIKVTVPPKKYRNTPPRLWLPVSALL